MRMVLVVDILILVRAELDISIGSKARHNSEQRMSKGVISRVVIMSLTLCNDHHYHHYYYV